MMGLYKGLEDFEQTMKRNFKKDYETLFYNVEGNLKSLLEIIKNHTERVQTSMGKEFTKLKNDPLYKTDTSGMPNNTFSLKEKHWQTQAKKFEEGNDNKKILQGECHKKDSRIGRKFGLECEEIETAISENSKRRRNISYSHAPNTSPGDDICQALEMHGMAPKMTKKSSEEPKALLESIEWMLESIRRSRVTNVNNIEQNQSQDNDKELRMKASKDLNKSLNNHNMSNEQIIKVDSEIIYLDSSDIKPGPVNEDNSTYSWDLNDNESTKCLDRFSVNKLFTEQNPKNLSSISTKQYNNKHEHLISNNEFRNRVVVNEMKRADVKHQNEEKINDGIIQKATCTTQNNNDECSDKKKKCDNQRALRTHKGRKLNTPVINKIDTDKKLEDAIENIKSKLNDISAKGGALDNKIKISTEKSDIASNTTDYNLSLSTTKRNSKRKIPFRSAKASNVLSPAKTIQTEEWEGRKHGSWKGWALVEVEEPKSAFTFETPTNKKRNSYVKAIQSIYQVGDLEEDDAIMNEDLPKTLYAENKPYLPKDSPKTVLHSGTENHH